MSKLLYFLFYSQAIQRKNEKERIQEFREQENKEKAKEKFE